MTLTKKFITFKDKRGLLIKILESKFKSCVLVTSKKGTFRANHYHKKDSHYCYILEGEVFYFTKSLNTKSKLKRIIVKKGEMVFTPPKLEHLFYFKKETKFIVFSPSVRTQKSYEKDLVRLNMNKYPEISKLLKKK